MDTQEEMNQYELNQDELNQDELNQDELNQDELNQEEMNQDELLHYESCQDELRDLEQERLDRYLNGEYDYQEDDSDDDEDPLPKWNIPNWKGNAKEQEEEQNQKENKCLYCVTRFTSENERRGCADCDEYWDMPDLIYSKTDADKDCVGCELLDGGEGGGKST